MLSTNEEYGSVEDDAIELYDQLFPRSTVRQFVPFRDEARSIFGCDGDHSRLDFGEMYPKARLHVLCLQVGYFFGWQSHSVNCLVLRDDSEKVKYMLYFDNSQRCSSDQALRFKAACLLRFVNGSVDDLAHFQSWIVQAVISGASSVCSAISVHYPTDHTQLSEFFVDPEVADMKIMLLFARLLYVYRTEFTHHAQPHSCA